MTDQPHTPTETTVRYWYIYARRASAEFNLEQVPDTSEAWAEFDRWLATVEAAAEQRGLERGWDEGHKSGLDTGLTIGEITHGIKPGPIPGPQQNPYRADQMEGDDV